VTTTIAELQSGVTTIAPRGALATARLSVQDCGPLLHDVLGDQFDSVVSIRLDSQVPGTTLRSNCPAGPNASCSPTTVRARDRSRSRRHD
jgi:hypothetical protein